MMLLSKRASERMKDRQAVWGREDTQKSRDWSALKCVQLLSVLPLNIPFGCLSAAVHTELRSSDVFTTSSWVTVTQDVCIGINTHNHGAIADGCFQDFCVCVFVGWRPAPHWKYRHDGRAGSSGTRRNFTVSDGEQTEREKFSSYRFCWFNFFLSGHPSGFLTFEQDIWFTMRHFWGPFIYLSNLFTRSSVS